MEAKIAVPAKIRDSNFELLRCICMFLIMCCHFKAHGLRFPEGEITFQYSLIYGITGWMGSFSNAIFMLISGYFMFNSKFTWKKELKIYSHLWFYSVIFGLVLYLGKINIYPQGAYMTPAAGPKIMDFQHLVANCMPFLTNQNWFVCGYLIYFALTPYLNKCLANLTREEHKKLIFVLLFVGGVLTNIPMQKAIDPSYLLEFIELYFIANYIKMYTPKIFENVKRNIIIGIFLLLFFTCWTIFLYFISDDVAFVRKHFDMLVSLPRNGILLQVAAIFVFAGFRLIQFKPSKIINLLGGATFGIYLLHNNRTFKHYMWFDLFKSQEHINSPYLILYMIGCVFVLFFICAGIDILRKLLVSFVFNYWTRKKTISEN